MRNTQKQILVCLMLFLTRPVLGSKAKPDKGGGDLTMRCELALRALVLNLYPKKGIKRRSSETSPVAQPGYLDVRYVSIDEVEAPILTPHVGVMRLNPDVTIVAHAMDMLKILPPKDVHRPKAGRIDGAVWVKDAAGKPLLVTTSENELALRFSRESGQTVATLKKFHSLRGMSWSPEIVASSPDGRYLVTAGGMSELALIDTHSQKMQRKLPFRRHEKLRNAASDVGDLRVFFSDDSRVIYVLSETGELNVWTLGVKGFSFDESTLLFRQMGASIFAYNPDFGAGVRSIDVAGDRLWIGSDDGTLCEYSLESRSSNPGYLIGGPVYSFGGLGESSVSKLRFDAVDYSLWATVDHQLNRDREPKHVSIFKVDLKSGEATLRIPGATRGSSVFNLVLLRDTVVLASHDPESSVGIWSRHTGVLLAKYTMERSNMRHYLSSSSGPFDPIHSLGVDKDQSRVAIGYDGGRVLVIDGATGLLQAAFSLDASQLKLDDKGASPAADVGDIRALAFNPSGSTLTVGAHRGFAGIYSVAKLLEGPVERPGLR